MVELFWGLYSLILGAALGRWFEIERAGKVRPFTVSIFYFFFAVGCLIVVFTSDVAATKLCFSAFACNSILVSVMYRLENDHEKYQQGAGMWITDVTILMAVTAYLTMAMDYANTKKLLNIMLLGSAASIVPHIFRRWRGKGRKEENL